MTTLGEHDTELDRASRAEVGEVFRAALLRSHRNRKFIGELESAAAQFCREMRRQGYTPECMLKDAKRVIEEAIDGEDAPVAERAVLSCIQHYYGSP
jgi:hypothetical protein